MEFPVRRSGAPASRATTPNETPHWANSGERRVNSEEINGAGAHEASRPS